MSPVALPPPPRPRLATRLRTRALWWLMRLVAFPRWRRLRERGLSAPLERVLLAGELQVFGGLVPRLLLSAEHFEPWGAQAFGVLTGAHEPMVHEALRRTLAPGAAFLDVGANIGAISLVAATLVGREGSVVSVDPQPECVAALRANAALNGYGHMTVVHAAAAARSGEAELLVVVDSLWTRLASVGEHGLERRRETVRTVALDDLVASGEAPPPDVVKIDVEGAELDVLAGMRGLLAGCRPVVICEMHGKNPEFCAQMERAGYRVTNLDGPEPVAAAGGNVHALCEPESESDRRPS